MEKGERIKLVSIAGPTASGKTALAVKLAKRFNGEIISADSMQIYKGMDIATAKPSEEEKMGVPHHLMDFLDPGEAFSVADFVKLAHEAANDIASRGKLPVLCGGTGLYIRSFLENISFSEQPPDPELRKELEERFEKEGGEAMISYLRTFDPETADKLMPSNRKRILRAIELYTVSGVTMSEQMRASRSQPPKYDVTAILLTFRDREKLYERIDKRVDKMMEMGLLDETKRFYSGCFGKTAAAAIGYKELKPYLDGECTLDEAVKSLKTATRHYAKRQLTWFRRDEYMHPVEVDVSDDVFEEAVSIIQKMH